MECILQRCSPPQNGDVSSTTGDDSFVDELLNLNSENTQDDDDNNDDETPLNDKSSVLLSFPPPPQPPSTSGEGHFGSLLTLPEEEEEADLEWLSHFVEDSFAQFNHATGASSPENQEPPFPAVLPRSRRSKRPRPAFPTTSRIWTSLSLTRSTTTSSSLTRSTTSLSSSSSSGTSSPSWPTSPSTPLALPDPNPKKKKIRAGPGPGLASASSRKCSHCGTQKTPQWRAGPMGTKTLCNACGVRFKAGRLLPEYRPACSPTFSSEVHSNSHRKVLEMRMKKETSGRTGPGFVPAGPNDG